MKIVVAIDSFKASASSTELNQAVKKGILSSFPEAEVKTISIADGGEGTISALQQGLGGKLIPVKTVDLLSRPIIAKYLLIGERAIIESATVIGIDKISPSVETVKKGSSAGLAALILDAKARGCKEILLTLGGSGTSDGGLGLLKEIKKSSKSLDLFDTTRIIGLTDVSNVYYGPQGFAQVFGPQKGASPEIVKKEDDDARKFANKIKKEIGIDLQKVSGSGAAGGLGAAVILMGGHLTAGFPKIASLLNIEEKLKGADLVITGEGRMDSQTSAGKVPKGIAELSQKYGLATIAFCGSLADNLGDMEKLLVSSFSIQRTPLSLSEAMKKSKTLKNIELLAQNVTRSFFYQSEQKKRK